MRCTLLMPCKDMLQLILVVIQEVIDGHDGTTRISEYRFNPFFEEGQNNGFRSAYLFCFHMLVIIKIYSTFLTAPLSADVTILAYAFRAVLMFLSLVPG